MGEEGFSSDSSLLYHRNLPSRITGGGVGAPETSATGRTIRSSPST